MNKQSGLKETQWKIVLSGLWVYFLLNIVFRDIHEFLRTGYLEQVISGVVYGNPITEQILLYSAVALQIPLLMVVLSSYMKTSITRSMNLITSTFMLASITLLSSNLDHDDIVFLFFQGMALISIATLAWKGPHKAEELKH